MTKATRSAKNASIRSLRVARTWSNDRCWSRHRSRISVMGMADLEETRQKSAPEGAERLLIDRTVWPPIGSGLPPGARPHPPEKAPIAVFGVENLKVPERVSEMSVPSKAKDDGGALLWMM